MLFLWTLSLNIGAVKFATETVFGMKLTNMNFYYLNVIHSSTVYSLPWEIIILFLVRHLWIGLDRVVGKTREISLILDEWLGFVCKDN